ncbi:hypothetical protein AB6A40_004390 [Gnathostoma spinigerum]|uniref:Uncharacterized protein n=1 Tax=Gnathostoma spinigerum TaxID=75299 RepID=A0ABD6EJT3_9BILA
MLRTNQIRDVDRYQFMRTIMEQIDVSCGKDDISDPEIQRAIELSRIAFNEEQEKQHVNQLNDGNNSTGNDLINFVDPSTLRLRQQIESVKRLYGTTSLTQLTPYEHDMTHSSSLVSFSRMPFYNYVKTNVSDLDSRECSANSFASTTCTQYGPIPPSPYFNALRTQRDFYPKNPFVQLSNRRTPIPVLNKDLTERNSSSIINIGPERTERALSLIVPFSPLSSKGVGENLIELDSVGNPTCPDASPTFQELIEEFDPLYSHLCVRPASDTPQDEIGRTTSVDDSLRLLRSTPRDVCFSSNREKYQPVISSVSLSPPKPGYFALFTLDFIPSYCLFLVLLRFA